MKLLKKMRITTIDDMQEQYNMIIPIIEKNKQIVIEEIQSVINSEKQKMQSDMRHIQDEINRTQSDVEYMHSEKQKIKSDIEFMKDEIQRIEKDLFECCRSLEYKLYDFNKAANILHYETTIKLNALQKNTRENFNPKVSIIIPAYNASKYIGQAIESALAQTYKNIEIIVVNDGSTDNGETERICLTYGDKIKYYKKENGGVSSALNLGISKMTGDYFAWLSHDDLYYPTNIYEHIRCLKNNKNEKIITFSNFNIIDENSNMMLRETIVCNLHCFDYKINQTKPEYSLLQGEINGGSVLIPKEAFEKCGLFDENLRISQERDMWFRLIQGGYTFFNIPLETTSIRFHSQQVTNTNSETDIETDQKRLEIVNSLKTEVKEKLEHSEYNFYTVMKNFYLMDNRKELVIEMDKHLKRLKNSSEGNKNNS